MNTRTKDRIHFIDYMRGFMVMVLVFDHSMHAYSQQFADLWFIKEIDRSTFIDVLHMHNDAIMMPFLFFLAGMFVLPSYERRGFISFFKEKFLRLVVPFVFGIHFIACFMKYHKRLIADNLEKGFFDYYWNDYLYWNGFLHADIAQGGFWFLYFLFLMTFGLLIIYTILPRVMDLLAGFCRWLVVEPLRGFLVFCGISAVILFLSDLMWGAHWWIGGGKVFYLRGSRWIQKILYFSMGAGFAYGGLTKDHDFLKRLGDSWKQWVLGAAIIGALYIGYSLSFFDEGAYSRALRYHFYMGGTWSDAWPTFFASAPMIFVRTTLLGMFMASLTVMYCAVFYRFLNKPNAFWRDLAACSFGIYILHEPFSSGMHVWMYGSPTDPVVKALVSGVVSLTVSWFLIKVVFLKLPGFKRIL